MTQHVHQHHPPVTLDAIAAIRYYVDRIVSSIEGMKVLLLDEETTQIVSTVYSQTTILEREVYLVERLNPDVPHEPMMHLRAVCFLRPTEENAALLARELAQPKYAEYHIFFSNICSANLLRSVAEADELESFLFASFGLVGVIALLYMKVLCKHFNDVQLILGGMVFMVASMLLMLGPDSFPVWRFYLAIFLMYAVGYPVGHTAAIGLFSKILGKRPQGYLMGVFGSAGSLARVVFPIVGGIIAERVSENALFSSGAAFLSVSALLLLAARDEVLHISQAEH
ncbi:hypothetical protein VYU27_008720 [Nannochloropsis oceanica]